MALAENEKSSSMEVEENDNPFQKLFAPTTTRKSNKQLLWSAEMDLYKAEERLNINVDPLAWWKVNQQKFPVLGIHFLIYLYIIYIFTIYLYNNIYI